MLNVSIMIEGQNGLDWPKWQRIVHTVESAGFAGLFRSDHVTNAQPPELPSLELWTSLTWLAAHTHRIHFGPLVSPVSFRDPVHTARMASSVYDLSGGRLILGLGAGWNEREHSMFGWELLDINRRFARFQEALEVITRLLNSDIPVDYQGDYYQMHQAVLLPRPQHPGMPPILIGGNGTRRSLPLVVRYAAIWNAVFLSPEDFANLDTYLDDLLVAAGKSPSEVKRTLMTNITFGSNDTRLKHALSKRGRTADELREKGLIVGTPNEVVDQLNQFTAAGVQEIMLQWLDLDDTDGLENLAARVLPQLNSVP